MVYLNFFRLFKENVKGALNPNFLNLTKNRETFCLYKRFGPIASLAFVKKLQEDFSPLTSIPKSS